VDKFNFLLNIICLYDDVSNNCGIGEQRYAGLQDCAISAQAQHTEEICLGPESSKRA
jgi:hypothetical protein